MIFRGTLAITARGDGNRWYGRISVPAEVAAAANIKEGTRVTARRTDLMIVIEADEFGRLKFPKARGKGTRRHAFEAATSTLGLKTTRMPQSGIHVEARDGQIRIHVPELWLSENHKPKPKPKKPKSKKPEKTKDSPVQQAGQKLWGTAAAIVTEARRSGKQVQPKSLAEIVEMIRQKGVDINVAGPRLFKLRGATVTSSDLLDEVNRLYGCSEQDRIALIMD